MRHELIKRLQPRLVAEGIEAPVAAAAVAGASRAAAQLAEACARATRRLGLGWLVLDDVRAPRAHGCSRGNAASSQARAVPTSGTPTHHGEKSVTCSPNRSKMSSGSTRALKICSRRTPTARTTLMTDRRDAEGAGRRTAGRPRVDDETRCGDAREHERSR